MILLDINSSTHIFFQLTLPVVFHVRVLLEQTKTIIFSINSLLWLCYNQSLMASYLMLFYILPRIKIFERQPGYKYNLGAIPYSKPPHAETVMNYLVYGLICV